MSTKLFLLFLCVAVGTLCGYIVMMSYKKNLSYLDGVCGMIGALKQNLIYKKDSVPLVLGSLPVSSSQLKKNIEEYIDFTAGKSDKRIVSRGFLSKLTFNEVSELFFALGGSDEGTQTAQLDGFTVKFDNMRTEAERKYKKYGSVAVKLGFLLGLGVGILVL